MLLRQTSVDRDDVRFFQPDEFVVFTPRLVAELERGNEVVGASGDAPALLEDS